MVCGDRALAYMNRVYDQNRQVSQLFSAKILYTAKAAEAVKAQLAEEKYKVIQLKRRLFRILAQSYAGQENVLHLEPELEPGEVRELADAIAEICGGIAAVASGQDDRGYSLCLVSRTQDVRPLGKAAFEALGGRGGGRADAVQGSVKVAEAQIRSFFEAQMGKIL